METLMTGLTPYSKLHALSKQTALFSSIYGLLDWDQHTYMPHDAIEIRSQQTETMAHLIHKEKTSKKFAKLLGKLIDISSGEIIDDTLSACQVAALRAWRRDYLKETKLPPAFVKKLAQTSSTAMHAWGQAKENDNFREFAPFLEKIVTLLRKKADFLGFKEHPYDALLDLYEPEMTTAYLTPLFTRLKSSLMLLLKNIISAKPISTDFLYGDFLAQKQLEFARELLRAMGFDEKSSRLDETVHPFCSGLYPKDTRMTTRVHRDYLMANIFAVLHEGGHGLYNMGLPVEHFGSPLCEPISLGVDESQSRWWETLIGHSLPFWQHFFPRLKVYFPEQFAKISLHDFHRAINSVKPSLIRIESDEVTYSLHIILRFEIEKALIEGSLKVKDIPEVWNAKMRESLGITPPTDRSGCLQDIHWSMGGIGYFPTYVLGNLYGAQCFTAFEKAHSTWKEQLGTGDLTFIRHWLHENIHRHGRAFTPQELIQRISGEPVSERAFTSYLEKKYSALYDLS